MKRVLIVDDHSVVRNGLKKILEDQPDEIAFGEAETASEAIAFVHEQDWDLVILDISLGGGRNGLDTLKEMKQIRPRLRVLILTMHAEEQYARRAFKAGAAGYVTKDSPRAELLEAIKRILGGAKYISPALAEKLIEYIDNDTALSAHEILSDREFQVLRLIASGKTVTEIAELLSLSDKTISTYRARILEKMRMKTNAELTYYAIRNRLVD
ncbi:MAG: DNA-binding response regulator [Acidobacteria bacterium]|nr:MAG: DNA-binding response regulator [Acidobacteriota bacterium]